MPTTIDNWKIVSDVYISKTITFDSLCADDDCHVGNYPQWLAQLSYGNQQRGNIFAETLRYYLYLFTVTKCWQELIYRIW